MDDGTNSPSTLFDDENSHQNVSPDSFDLELESRDDTPLHSTSMSSSSNNYKKSMAQFSSLKRDSIMSKLFNHPIISKAVSGFGSLATLIFNILNYGLFIYFLIQLPTGVACWNLLGQGVKVFNLLAHFIKGGVFFSLGILTIARYCGGFTKLGGAWNYSYITKQEKGLSVLYRIQPKETMITFEMIESSLILFYGSTNIFLEHLASEDGVWTPKDLQHLSIAFMYIGAGLCGVITELKLSQWRKDKFYDQIGESTIDREALANVSPGLSPNPFPVFTIFWTGLLMSQHAQASMLATKVHVQWGNLLTYGSLFRVITFFQMMYFPLKEKSSLFRPSKPLTELVVGFCLLCGGLVFMESTDQSIAAMEYRGLTAMFTINVSVGVIALVMAWIMVVFAFKDWLKKKMYG
ncbi:unnamed protein product [Ambrosiozyma monospora]|uniref:Unnamed protein product n=1 Tax=Ambrosiozyma monospora TaxID=43982 RepID=A0A9W6Z6A3_AMBMO|nr:unnamed protein product [Ambrosiozyma monospora]